MRAWWGWKSLFVVGVTATSFAACRCERPGTVATRPDAALDGSVLEVDAGAASAPTAVLLLNDESIEEATWTADGAVVARSRHRFWWFRPDDGGRAQTTVLTVDEHFPHLAVAKGTDVLVVTAGGKAHVFRGPKEVSSFAVAAGEEAKALSEDGTVFVTERMESSSKTGLQFRGRLYDVATGKRLSDDESVPVISPNGEWTITRQRIRATRTGEEILALPEHVSLGLVPSPWFDGGAMAWTPSGLVVADPKARSVVTLPAQCKDGEVDELIEVVDRASKQAVRFCGRRVFVVRLGTGAPVVVEVPIPASRKDAKPSLGFARDDGAPVLVWGFPAGAEIDRIDIGARSLVKSAKGIERPTARTTDEEGAPSPDGRYRLRVESFLSRNGAVIVEDAAHKEIVRFGVTIGSGTPNGAMAPFVHEHGVDVIVGEGAKQHRVRIGPDAPPLENIPRLIPDGPCGGKESDMMPAPPQRTLTGDAAIFSWPMGGTCICVRGGCADPKLPPGVVARRDDKLITSEPGGTEVTYLEQRKPRGTARLAGEVRGAAFLDDGASAALLTQRRTSTEENWFVSEAKLPGFTERSQPVEIEHPTFYGWDYTLYGTKAAIAVFLSDRYALKGWILPRGPRGPRKGKDGGDGGGVAKLTRIEAWDDSAVVTLPDGRVDLYGPSADHALVCADGLGAITPFATCRARFEAKGAFHID